MRTLAAAIVYFALVFGAGLVLGPIRVLWLVPRLGERAAELLEAPIMVVVIVLVARWTVRRLSVPPAASSRLSMGSIALALVLVTEIGVVLGLRGMTLTEYIAGRDPVAGIVYLLLLALFALAPISLNR